MKNRINKWKFEFIHLVKPKWKYFVTTILVILGIDVVFYILTHSPILSTDPILDRYFVLPFCILLNIMSVFTNFNSYASEGYSRLYKVNKNTYLKEVILADEHLSKLYHETADHNKSELVTILYENSFRNSTKIEE